MIILIFLTALDCWISNYSKTIQVSQIWVSEQVTIEYSDLISEIRNDVEYETYHYNKTYTDKNTSTKAKT